MDWSRAKTIFIITFFILDVFLLYQLIYQKMSIPLNRLKSVH